MQFMVEIDIALPAMKPLEREQLFAAERARGEELRATGAMERELLANMSYLGEVPDSCARNTSPDPSWIAAAAPRHTKRGSVDALSHQPRRQRHPYRLVQRADQDRRPDGGRQR